MTRCLAAGCAEHPDPDLTVACCGEGPPCLIELGVCADHAAVFEWLLAVLPDRAVQVPGKHAVAADGGCVRTAGQQDVDQDLPYCWRVREERQFDADADFLVLPQADGRLPDGPRREVTIVTWRRVLSDGGSGGGT